MLALGKRESAPVPETPTASAAGAPIEFRSSHRPLPGGGRVFVTLTDGTPVGMIRYDLEQKGAMGLLLRAFAAAVQEREEPR